MEEIKLLSRQFFAFIFGRFHNLNAQSNNNMLQQEKNLPTTVAPKMNETTAYALVGGGCFWCVEAVYQRLKGVTKVESGYAGGHVENPTYGAVCDKTTGHVEVALITFNPQETSYEEILEVFFRTHNPTTLNRQGNDVGPQYRSEIFYYNEAQKEVAEKMVAEYAPQYWEDPIVTAVTEFVNYYPAEDYHQNYYNDHTREGYCMVVVGPKVKKFEKEFKDRLKD
jgi:peptide-methionine (S)-S-oxide reductase